MGLGSFEKMLKGLYPNDSDPKILCDHTYNKAKNQDKILIKVCRSDFNDIINIVFKNDKLTNKSINNIKPYYTKEEFTDAYLDNKFDILEHIQHQYEHDFDFLLDNFEESKDNNLIKDLEKLINKMILLTIRYPGFKSPMYSLYGIAYRLNKDFIDKYPLHMRFESLFDDFAFDDVIASIDMYDDFETHNNENHNDEENTINDRIFDELLREI